MTVQCDYTLMEYSQAIYEMKKKPMLFFKVISVILLCAGAAGAIYDIVAKQGEDTYVWFLTVLALVTGFFLAAIMLLSTPKPFAKRLVKTTPALKDGVKQSFIFDEDEFEVREMLGSSSGNQKMKYSALIKATESEHYLFLYINALSAYPVKKSALSEEELKELKKILTAKVGKTNMKSAA